jgi:hypothetical protein
MKTGFLFSWTAMLAVGLASAQTPGSSPAPAGQPPSGGQGAAAVPSANGQPATDAKPASGTPVGVQAIWDDSGNGASGHCGLLCSRPWAGHNGDYAPDGCLENNRWWIEGEYLLWRVSDFMDGDTRSGFRVTAGIWADESHCLGFEASFLFLDFKRSTSTVLNEDLSQTGLVGVPVPVTLIIDAPSAINPNDLLTSQITSTSYFRLWGVEGNFRRTVWWIGGLSFDVLAGFRHLNLDETLNLNGDFTFQDFNAGETTAFPTDPRTLNATTLDTVQTHDQFYGAQVGASFSWHCYRVTVDGLAKFAVGGTSEQETSGGMTNLGAGFVESTTGPGFVARPATSLPGGLLSANAITSRSRTRISVLPELKASLGYQVTPNLRAFIAYDFLWWTNVAIISSETTGTFGTKDVWFQGVDFGVQLRF